MARGLYRVYLYVVTILLLVFATVSASSLLSALLRLTPLRGSYGSAPSNSDVVQNVVLAIVTLLIVAAFGGLHYWLIRRDMASDPHAGESGVRALTLNLSVGVATLVATFAGASALSTFDLAFQYDTANSLAVALAALALALALEWERRRATPTRGAALIFQRLRIDGVGLILVLSLLAWLPNAVSQTETLIGQASGALSCTSIQPTPNGPYFGPYLPPCVGSQIIGQWGAAALVIVVWLLYLRLNRNDRPMLIHPVFLLLGYSAGVVALITGLERIIEYVSRVITANGGALPDYLNNYDAAPIFVYAVLTLVVYLRWLGRPAAHEPLDAPTTRLTIRAIGAAIFAAPFWVGAAMLLNNLFISAIPGATTDTTNWHTAVAITLAGTPYIPLAFWLGAGVRAEGVKGPRRGFVLALLAAGALATAGGAATLIYAALTATLGFPLSDWQGVARVAGSALIVGVVVGLLYLWIAAREGQFARAPRPEAPPAGAPATGAVAAPSGVSLDEVLTQFQQGGLTQAETAERIRALAQAGALR